jgi:hypothetical protein
MYRQISKEDTKDPEKKALQEWFGRLSCLFWSQI